MMDMAYGPICGWPNDCPLVAPTALDPKYIVDVELGGTVWPFRGYGHMLPLQPDPLPG